MSCTRGYALEDCTHDYDRVLLRTHQHQFKKSKCNQVDGCFKEDETMGADRREQEVGAVCDCDTEGPRLLTQSLREITQNKMSRSSQTASLGRRECVKTVKPVF